VRAMAQPVEPPVADGPMRSAVAVAPERLESGDLGAVAGATDDAWAKVLAKVVPACVVLKGALPKECCSLCLVMAGGVSLLYVSVCF